MREYNLDNLTSLGDRPIDERRRIASAGGRASVVSRRKMRNMREAARALLESGLPTDATEARERLEALGLEPDQQSAILLAAIDKGRAGDIEAARFVRDTSGQAPSQAIDISSGSTAADELKEKSDAELLELINQASDSTNK